MRWRLVRAVLVVAAAGCSSEFEVQLAVAYDGVDAVTWMGAPAANPTVITATFDRYSDACSTSFTFGVTYGDTTAPFSFSPCTCGGGTDPASHLPFDDITTEDDGYRIYVKDGAITTWGEGGCSNGSRSCNWEDGGIDDGCDMLGGDE